MKDRFLFLLFFALIFSVSICSAAKNINSDRAAIGGIAIGSSTDYTKSIYGDPNKIKKTEDGQNIETWYYGETFQIEFIDGLAVSIISSGANGLSTPDEISVGMKKDNMKSKYGKPNHSDKYKDRAIYTYSVAGDVEMTFIVNNSVISEIRILKN